MSFFCLFAVSVKLNGFSEQLNRHVGFHVKIRPFFSNRMSCFYSLLSACDVDESVIPWSDCCFQIGQGTYSNVYKARDLESRNLVALKKVRFDLMDPESVKFMAREIIVLRRLDHPNVIKLEGVITSRMSSSLYLVFEYMEHDLAGLAASPGVHLSEPQVNT